MGRHQWRPHGEGGRRRPALLERLQALQKNRYNIKETARAMGVSRPTIYRWMRKNNIVITRVL
ncbi:helix-turn-helix domain-containing protein [Propionivibrio dicarboxylicus]|uniref:helix-turn-helix domain-containing protein n=1 Tax=Propionivibrio dicarboxylicus TaxID=83767 RepID=UPI003CCBCCF7